jgi:8-oxo-dGTP diphosphatase
MKIRQVFTSYSSKDDTHPRQFKYCPFCSVKLSLNENGSKQRPTCPNCGYIQYTNPLPGVVVVIEKNNKVLLGKRVEGFGKGKWCLPQGYIEFEEDFLTAAIREVKEETDLDVEIKAIINVVSNLISPKLHTVTIVLLGNVKAGKPCAGDDMETLEWFPFSGSLPEMAFGADEYIIKRYQDIKLKRMLPVDPLFSFNISF